MNIRMIGIDHRKASVEYREQFSFTKKNGILAMKELMNKEWVTGCIILSTCNRMELWISYEGVQEEPLLNVLCGLKKADPEIYKEYFTERDGMRAVKHLFYLAGGLESKILGDDQIITQVKDALDLSRTWDCTDSVLEVLFRQAVTAAKKVKSSIRIARGKSSAAEEALLEMKKRGMNYKEKKCMVIGNGIMGKAAALFLKGEGADVTVTVRQYRSGEVNIPEGCKRINYGERYEFLPACDFVVSATASPNRTLKTEEVIKSSYKENVIFLDLAVPRDIDPEIGNLSGITLYDIDSFGIDKIDSETRENIKQAKSILKDCMMEFKEWYECRDLVPKVRQISSDAAFDVERRIEKVLKKSAGTGEEKKQIAESVEKAANKVVSKLLFQLKEEVPIDTWRECVEGMNHIFEPKEEKR